MSGQDSQDIGKQTASQMGNIGKKTGGKLGKKVVGKVAKKLKKFMASIIKKVVIGVGKALLAFIGPWGCLILIVAMIFLAILASIPFADWFMDGGKRTQDQIKMDTDYEDQFRKLANQSVAEIDNIKANEDWKANFKNIVKPSWGIPTALVKYNIVKANQKIELPDPEEMFTELKPIFTYKTISDDLEYFQNVITCTITTTSTDKNGKKVTSTSTTTNTTISSNILPPHKVMDRVITAYGETTLASLKRYYPGGHDGGFTTWEYIGTTSSGNCSTAKYRQWEDTQVDDRGVPTLEVDAEKFKQILISKGVLEEDIRIVLEFASVADEYFYAEQFDPRVKSGAKYGNVSYDFDGVAVDGWVWPVANNRTITSSFGPRWGKFHYGVDLGGSKANGLPILAAKDGLVILSQWSDSYGNWIVIAHDDGLQTRYAHMSSLTVKANTSVVAGQQIGILGTTGRSTGPHLHFETLQPGRVSPLAKAAQMENAYDPMIFLGRVLGGGN